MPRAFPLLLALCLAAAAAGCRSASVPAPPPPLTITLAGADSLNSGGNAVVVRIYSLTGDAAFQQTPVHAFWRDGSQALVADLVSTPRELTLFPGATEVVSLPADARAQFIGVAADLRTPVPDGWRAVYPVSALEGKRMAVSVNERDLTVSLESQ